MKKPNAADAAAAVSDGPSTFYLRKKSIRPIIVAITMLQERSDLSGKFARKVGKNRRALSAIDDQIVDERKELTLHHAEKFPEGHADAGKPTPVYAENEKGEPIFKKDKAGNDTDERIAYPDRFNLADPAAFEHDFKEMLEEFVEVTCPGFKEDEFNAFKGIAGKIVDPLLDLEVGGETTKIPAGYEPAAVGLSLVDEDPARETPVVEEAPDTEEGARSAP